MAVWLELPFFETEVGKKNALRVFIAILVNLFPVCLEIHGLARTYL